MSWTEELLGDICARNKGLIQTGPFGSQLHESDYSPDGIPVVMPKDIIDGKINNNTVARVDESVAAKLSRHRLTPGTIIFPRRGDINKRGLISESETGYLCGTGCIKVELGIGELLPKYFYYFLHQPHIVEWIERNAVGTTMLNLNTSIIKGIKVRYPILPAQQKIASILSAYDDLIDNNRKRIALLEKAARLLYEEWFVRLQFPGHEHTPVVNGVPEGWESGTISSFFDTASGGTPSRAKEAYYTGSYNWVKTKELNNNFIFDTEEKITEEAIKGSAAKLFPKQTILVAMYGATVGELGILGVESATNQACCAILPTEGISYVYTYLFFLTQKEKLISLSMGAAQKNVSQQIIRSMPMTLPKKGILSAFSAIVEPIFEQLRVLQIQTQKLQATRDLLLPRLMSGELAV